MDDDSFTDDSSPQRHGPADDDFAPGSARVGEVAMDKPYDEMIELGASSDSNVSTPESSPVASPAQSPPQASGLAGTGGLASDAGATWGQTQLAVATHDSSDDNESSSDDETSDEDEDKGLKGGYNAADYKDLKCAPEVSELFQYIGRYKPQNIELDSVFKPFIPDFVPAVGEVDGFIKIPRADGKDVGELGLARLDEPCLNPSDPTVLDLQLRAITKTSNVDPIEVRSIDNAETNPKEVENWVNRITDLHRMQPPALVQYSRRMPEIDQLMQVWPQEMEQYMEENPLPLDELDLPLSDFVKLVAVLLDVPAHTNLTDTLHTIFTLFAEFKGNPHFNMQHMNEQTNANPYGDDYDVPAVIA